MNRNSFFKLIAFVIFELTGSVFTVSAIPNRYVTLVKPTPNSLSWTLNQ